MADGTLKVGTITTSSGSGTITLGQSGETVDMANGSITLNSDMKNTPAFQVKKTSTQSIPNATVTKLTWDAEDWDTDSAFASDKFTVPSGKAGKYYFQVTTEITGIDDGEYVQLRFHKNGSSQAGTTARWYSPGSGNDVRARTNVILDLSATDYVEAYVYHTEGGSRDASSSESFFRGYKIIE